MGAALTGRVRTSSFHVVVYGTNFENLKHVHDGKLSLQCKSVRLIKMHPGCADNSFKEHGELCFVVAMPTPTGGAAQQSFFFGFFFFFCFITQKKYSQSGHMHFKMCIKVMIPLRTSSKREHFIFYKLSDFLCFGSFFFLPSCWLYNLHSGLVFVRVGRRRRGGGDIEQNNQSGEIRF